MTMHAVSGFTKMLDWTTNHPDYHCLYTTSVRMPAECVKPKLEQGHYERVASDPKDCCAHPTDGKLKKKRKWRRGELET